ncbi:MAG: HD domain-containing protein [Bacilli bacterium]|nr:HD domain-containing protein [Bacilli bacterium]
MDSRILKNMNNKNLSEYATLDSEVIKFKEESDIRTPFFRDIDKILYTLSYTRYMNKTQVFSFKENDHLTKRMVHVQYVSKIARTIGRALGLNEDLIEAAALGHDLGHVPFGHFGEKILNQISLENNEGYFNHNIHSVRTLLYIENYGKGANISLQVLDAIMCHNGEFALGKYHTKPKSQEDFFREYENSYHDKEAVKNLVPMTLEGCVVRISDLIAYLGRDIDDAKRLNLITFNDIPENIKTVLGTSTKEIVNNITLDVIENSIGKNYILLSEDVYKAIVDLKKFNYQNIYDHAYSKEEKEEYTKMFYVLFDKYLKDLETNNQNSPIHYSYLNNMCNEYKENNSNARIVIDYIAGMSDEYFIKQYKHIEEGIY